jgi:outer membrane protein
MLLAGVAGAQKIGVIDMKAIADKSTRIQADLKKSQGQVQTQQELLDGKMNQIQQLRQELNQRRTAMTDAEVSAQEEKIQSVRDEYNDLQTALNKQIAQIQRQVLRPQAERIQKIISDVARQQNIDVVLDAEAVIYHSDAVDITPVVVQIFDRQAPAPAEPQSTATPADATPKSSEKSETKSDSKSDTKSDKSSTKSTRSRRKS